MEKVVKVKYNDDIKRIAVPNTNQWESFVNQIKIRFSIFDMSKAVMKYIDSDGDNIRISSSAEFQDALESCGEQILKVSLSFQGENSHNNNNNSLNTSMCFSSSMEDSTTLEREKQRQRQREKDSETKESECHPNIKCNGCKNRIFGFRYKCGYCKDYDLCEQCEKVTSHDPSHIFLKIKRPLDSLSDPEWFQKQPVLPPVISQSEIGSSFQKIAPLLENAMESYVKNNPQETKKTNIEEPKKVVEEPATSVNMIVEEPKKVVEEPSTSVNMIVEEPKKVVEELAPTLVKMIVQEPTKTTETETKKKVEETLPFVPLIVEETYEKEMKKLLEMGFFDRKQNLKLLKENKGDISMVISKLTEDSNWYTTR